MIAQSRISTGFSFQGLQKLMWGTCELLNYILLLCFICYLLAAIRAILFSFLSPLSDEAIIIVARAFTQPGYSTRLSPSNILFVPQLKIGLSFMNTDDTVTLFTFNGLC